MVSGVQKALSVIDPWTVQRKVLALETANAKLQGQLSQAAQAQHELEARMAKVRSDACLCNRGLALSAPSL
eukprot:COSAG05_NODE_881_length_6789_cov_21.387743_1_plen_71_part_00